MTGSSRSSWTCISAPFGRRCRHTASLRVRPDTFVCDAYLFYSGDSDTINAYRGEYMSAYPWASMTEGILFWNATNKN